MREVAVSLKFPADFSVDFPWESLSIPPKIIHWFISYESTKYPYKFCRKSSENPWRIHAKNSPQFLRGFSFHLQPRFRRRFPSKYLSSPGIPRRICVILPAGYLFRKNIFIGLHSQKLSSKIKNLRVKWYKTKISTTTIARSQSRPRFVVTESLQRIIKDEAFLQWWIAFKEHNTDQKNSCMHTSSADFRQILFCWNNITTGYIII